MKSLIHLSNQPRTASIERVNGGPELFIDNDHVTAFRERANLLGRKGDLKAIGGKPKTAFELHQARRRGGDHVYV